MAGPLAGVRVVEFAGLGPTPFAGMMLADLGAEVLRVERVGSAPQVEGLAEWMNRGRPFVTLDLKSQAGRRDAVLLVAAADMLLEGFRPGVMERLELGPQPCLAANPALVYVRVTGWGQTGAQALKAGHDINYIARAGALWPLGPAAAPPPPPLNLVGDFGGGGMLAVVGALAALVSARATGAGQVVDAAMVDGAALLTTQLHGWRASDFWADTRGSNLLDGGCYFYRCYGTADGGWLAVGAIEPQFHAALLQGLGFEAADFSPQMDRAAWRERAARFEVRFAERTRDAWIRTFEGLDACVSPVLSPAEASVEADNASRDLFFTDEDGTRRPAPAPRFSRTPQAPRLSGDAQTRLSAWGVTLGD